MHEKMLQLLFVITVATLGACGESGGSGDDDSTINSPPTISLNGDATASILFGTNYADPGATATDIEDGDLTSGIAVVSNLDTGVAGNYTITYSVTDSAGASASISRIVTVTAVNDPTTVVDDTATTVEDTAVDIDLLANDTDVDGKSPLASVTQGSNGTVTMNPNGTVNYTPNADFTGDGSFTYTNGEGSVGMVTVTVTAVNDPTTVVDDTATTVEDTAVDIDLLANDTDVDSKSPVASVTQGSNGTVTMNPNGTVNYTPNANFTGDDSFTYTNGEGSVGTVTVTVSPNSIPVIALLGNAVDSIGFGASYTDPGATATDTEDGDISAAVTVETSLDTRFPGDYTLTYRVSDSVGAAATPVVRYVTVEEPLVQTREDAFRFLQRTTFGPTVADIATLTAMGYETWLDQQLVAAPGLQLPDLLVRMSAAGYQTTDTQVAASATQVQRLREDAWFEAVLNGEDQLRQRVAFALSEILVVSWRDNSIRLRPQGLANYNDILVRNAFGNYRDLLQEVTLSPIMGHYLSMRRNEKANAAENILPDENYAREVMQLFSIGLDLLSADGTPQLDGNDQKIPAYTQQDILNFARVYTGWNYGDAPRLRSNARTLQSELIPMTAFENFHDTDPKTLLLGVQIPGGRSADEDLDSALDNIFNHPNVGPFIGKQLILKLVTSNPSPEYVERVADAFNDNGLGVRGDLGATLRAILMDPEALLGHRDDPMVFGKLKEPLLKFTALWRAFDAEGAVPGRIRFTNTDLSLGQEHLRAPSVFNFFQPGFSKPGELRNLQLLSPEFQILGESKAIGMHNELRTQALSSMARSSEITVAKNPIILDIEFEKTLAGDPQILVDHLIDKLIGAPINATTRTTIIVRTAQRALNDDGENRVEEALYLLSISPEFAVQL